MGTQIVNILVVAAKSQRTQIANALGLPDPSGNGRPAPPDKRTKWFTNAYELAAYLATQKMPEKRILACFHIDTMDQLELQIFQSLAKRQYITTVAFSVIAQSEKLQSAEQLHADHTVHIHQLSSVVQPLLQITTGSATIENDIIQQETPVTTATAATTVIEKQNDTDGEITDEAANKLADELADELAAGAIGDMTNTYESRQRATRIPPTKAASANSDTPRSVTLTKAELEALLKD